jgi:hypothetical protein
VYSTSRANRDNHSPTFLNRDGMLWCNHSLNLLQSLTEYHFMSVRLLQIFGIQIGQTLRAQTQRKCWENLISYFGSGELSRLRTA